MTSVSPTTDREPAGFGGWLVLIIVLQVISLLYIAYVLLQMLGAYGSVFSRFPLAVIGEFLLNGALAVVVAVTTVQMFQKSRSFQTWYYRQYWVSLAVPVADWVWVAMTIATPPGRYTGALALNWVIRLVVGGLLVAYVSQSRRVENTFVQ